MASGSDTTENDYSKHSTLCDYKYKILVVGDSGVGKTCILLRYTDDTFKSTFIATIDDNRTVLRISEGIDYKIRTVDIDGKKITLQIWDTAGQERFKKITTAYYKGAMGIMLVYDITNEKSFDNITNWIENVEENADAGVEKMILSNKCDLSDSRVVSKERGQSLADEHGIKFMEISAKTSINVEEAFLTLAKDIKAKIEKPDGQQQSQSSGGRAQQLKTRDKQDKRNCILS